MVGPEGMEKFCEDIGVEPENVSVCSFSHPHSVKNLLHRLGKTESILDLTFVILKYVFLFTLRQ